MKSEDMRFVIGVIGGIALLAGLTFFGGWLFSVMDKTSSTLVGAAMGMLFACGMIGKAVKED
jgi:hypothetical protein